MQVAPALGNSACEAATVAQKNSHSLMTKYKSNDECNKIFRDSEKGHLRKEIINWKIGIYATSIARILFETTIQL